MKYVSLLLGRKDIGMVATVCGIPTESAQIFVDLGQFRQNADGTYDPFACLLSHFVYLGQIHEMDDEDPNDVL